VAAIDLFVPLDVLYMALRRSFDPNGAFVWRFVAFSRQLMSLYGT
jgi:hypothetical protein